MESPQSAPPAPSSGHSVIEKLKGTRPAEIVAMPEVQRKFLQLFQAFNRQDAKTAAVVYEQEKFNFAKLVTSSDTLAACDPITLYGCFLDAAVNGLSFDPTKKHVYLIPYGKQAQLHVSPYGELLTRQRAGQILYADNPVLVYDGDHFRYSVKDGKTNVDFEAVIPRKPEAQIIACFLMITRPDGTTDYKVLTMDEVLKLRKFSKSAGSTAWTDGLPGMIQAKTLKHAFRSYPKVPLRGSFASLVSDRVEDIDHEEVVDYGLGGETLPDPQPGAQYEATAVVTPAAPAAQPAPPAQPQAQQRPASADLDF